MENKGTFTCNYCTRSFSITTPVLQFSLHFCNNNCKDAYDKGCDSVSHGFVAANWPSK